MIKIGARKCTIKEIDFETTKNFLNQYHRQKSVYSLYNIGLFYESMLIGVMTFGYPRYNKRYQWELLRLCFHKEYRVVGGTQKMFNYFVDEYKPQSIISYCDYNYFTGDIYDKLGFELIRVSKGGKIWKKGEKFITDNLLRKFGADKLIGTHDGKNTNNEEILLREGWTYEIDEKGQGTYIWTGEGKFGYIYLITDTLHCKQYIGQRRGYKLDENYYGSGRIIQDLIKKYGTEIFKREIVDYASSQEELSKKEVEYIEKYDTLYPNGYNLTLRLQAIDPYIEKKLEYTEERLKRMSEITKKMWKNEEFKIKFSNYMRELWMDDVYKKKMSDIHKEIWKDDDYKKKILAQLNFIQHDDDCIQKAKTKRNKTMRSDEFRKKQSEILKNVWENIDYRSKMCDIRKNQVTDETRKKNSEHSKKMFSNENFKIRWKKAKEKAMNTKEYRDKIANSSRGRKWWNNGTVSKFQREKPEGDEWVQGRLKKIKMYEIIENR